jgi:hypothetical protein
MSKLANVRRRGRPLSGSTRINIALAPALLMKLDGWRKSSPSMLSRNAAVRTIIAGLPVAGAEAPTAGKVADDGSLVWAFDKDGSFVCADLHTLRTAFAPAGSIIAIALMSLISAGIVCAAILSAIGGI